MSKESHQIQEKYMKSFLDKNGNTMLHKAVKENNLAFLYKSALYESAINQQNRDGYSALHYAVKHGDKQMIEAVLQCGVDPLLKTKLNQTATDMALLKKRIDIVDLIDSYSPGLYHTIINKDKNKSIDLVKKWVNLANIIKSATTEYQKNLVVFHNNFDSMGLEHYLYQNQFIHLVAADEFEQVDKLINHGGQQIIIFANNTHAYNGMTPLAMAISNFNVKMVELLLNIGADPKIRLSDGTPLSHFSWNINAPFKILISILKSDPKTWHMRCPTNGMTIIFTLASSSVITTTHIHKILSITQCMVLRDRDNNNLDFYEFCKLNNRQDLIEAMWTAIAEMIESKSGKMKLINLAIGLAGSAVLSVPTNIFKDIYIDKQLETILRDYEHFMGNVSSLQLECIELFNAVRRGDLAKVKQHNVADFIDNNGRNALHEAIIYDKYEIAQWLLAERPSLLTISDTSDRYPFHYAYGVVNSYGSKYIHLLLDMRSGLDQEWLTDMHNKVPSSMEINLVEEILRAL